MAEEFYIGLLTTLIMSEERDKGNLAVSKESAHIHALKLYTNLETGIKYEFYKLEELKLIDHIFSHKHIVAQSSNEELALIDLECSPFGDIFKNIINLLKVNPLTTTIFIENKRRKL